jgi:hypothetical protein
LTPVRGFYPVAGGAGQSFLQRTNGCFPEIGASTEAWQPFTF